jgi:hypothetical protein
MRRLIIFFLTPVFSLLVILFEVPAFERWLDGETDTSPLYLMIAIVICVILSHILSVISPFRKYEKIEKNKWALINELARLVIEDSSFSKFRFAVNVMTVERKLYSTQEPHPNLPEKRKICFFPLNFKFIWSYNGKPIDKRVKLTSNQGSSGIAYNQGDIVLKVAQVDDWKEFNLNTNQKKAISELQLIISCPIFSFDKYNKPTDKIIGILNVSSNTKNVKVLLRKPEDRRILCEKIADFSNICSLIM